MTQHPNLFFFFLLSNRCDESISVLSMVLSKERYTRLTSRFPAWCSARRGALDLHSIQPQNPNTESKHRSPHRIQTQKHTQNPNTEAHTESISVPSMVLSKERRTRLTQNPNTESKHRSPHRIQTQKPTQIPSRFPAWC